MIDRRPLFVAIIAFILSFPSVSAQAFEIAVVKEDSPLRFSGKTVGTIKKDEIVKVREIRGAWVDIGKTTKQEWIRRDQLRSPEDTLAEVKKRRAKDRGNVELQQAEATLFVLLTPADRLLSELQRRFREEPSNPYLRFEAGRYEFNHQLDDRGFQEFDAAIAINPRIGEFYAQRGRANLSRGNQSAALDDFFAAEKHGVADALVYNNLAWHLATHRDQKRRDGKKAIVFAEKACELTGYADPQNVDTLAAAYAEDGQYNEAIKWQEKAIALGPSGGDEFFGYEERLKLYRDGKPYRE